MAHCGTPARGPKKLAVPLVAPLAVDQPEWPGGLLRGRRNFPGAAHEIRRGAACATEVPDRLRGGAAWRRRTYPAMMVSVPRVGGTAHTPSSEQVTTGPDTSVQDAIADDDDLTERIPEEHDVADTPVQQYLPPAVLLVRGTGSTAYNGTIRAVGTSCYSTLYGRRSRI